MSIQKYKNTSKGFRGYIFSREINSNFIPHRVQNLVIKDFAQRKNLFFKLSSTEYIMKKSFYMLKALLKDINFIDGVIFYSYEMFFDNVNLCIDFSRKLIEKKKHIYFAVEEIEIKSRKDLVNLKKIFQIKKKAANYLDLKNIISK